MSKRKTESTYKSRPNITQIAKIAGVSPTVVSLVLNHKARQYRIHPNTEQKVKKIIEEQKFLPSELARGFRLKKTKTIGLIIADISNWFFSEIAKKLEKMARDKGFTLLIGSSEDEIALEEDIMEKMAAKSVDGMIIASVKDAVTKKRTFHHSTPVVFLDRRVGHGQYPCVSSDNKAGAFQLIRHFLESGIRRIAFIGGLKNVSTEQERLAGYRMALEKFGIRYDRALIKEDAFRPEFGWQAARDLFSRPASDWPQAIFTASFTILEGVLKYINETDKNLFQRTRLGTFDNHPLLDILPVAIDAVEQDTQQLTETAFALLQEGMQGKRVVSLQRIIPPRLIIRYKM